MIETLAAEAGESHGVDEPVQNCAAVSRALAARDESQPSVEEMAEVRYKALSDAARVCDEIAKLMEVKANDANAQRKNEDEDEFDARADTAKHIGMKIRALAKAALSALPAPEEKPIDVLTLWGMLARMGQSKPTFTIYDLERALNELHHKTTQEEGDLRDECDDATCPCHKLPAPDAPKPASEVELTDAEAQRLYDEASKDAKPFGAQEVESFVRTTVDPQAEVLALQKQRNDVYEERDRLVAALSKCFPSWLARHPNTDRAWDDDWRWIVFVQLPTGQATWHIHDRELPWFAHLKRRTENVWDGSCTNTIQRQSSSHALSVMGWRASHDGKHLDSAATSRSRSSYTSLRCFWSASTSACGSTVVRTNDSTS
jgi:hypothetical protein